MRRRRTGRRPVDGFARQRPDVAGSARPGAADLWHRPVAVRGADPAGGQRAGGRRPPPRRFWRAQYGADLARLLAADLAGRGFAALNIEYRRVGSGPGGGGGFPATFDDVSSAIELLGSTGLDLTHVVAVGHSAGGQLAAWSAARRRLPRWASASVAVTAVVSQAGILDLTTADREGLGGGAVAALLGARSTDRRVYDLADPMRQLPLDVPVRCVHGRADDVVPVSQSQDYVRAARAAGADATVTLVDGDHFAPPARPP